MSHQLVICLIAIAANLAGTLILYGFLSSGLAGLALRGRGWFAVIALLVVLELFWIAPAVGIVEALGGDRAGSYALWFGNWLVSGFGLALFGKSVRRIPAGLDDAARLDGLGGFAKWRRVVLPFVGNDLVVLALLTAMATLLPFWGMINQPKAGDVITLFERGSSFTQHLVAMIAASLLGVIPLLGILFVTRRD